MSEASKPTSVPEPTEALVERVRRNAKANTVRISDALELAERLAAAEKALDRIVRLDAPQASDVAHVALSQVRQP